MSFELEPAPRFARLHRVVLGWSARSLYYGYVELSDYSGSIIDCVSAALTPGELVSKLAIYIGNPERAVRALRSVVNKRDLPGGILHAGQVSLSPNEVADGLDAELRDGPRLRSALHSFVSQAVALLRGAA